MPLQFPYLLYYNDIQFSESLQFQAKSSIVSTNFATLAPAHNNHFHKHFGLSRQSSFCLEQCIPALQSLEQKGYDRLNMFWRMQFI